MTALMTCSGTAPPRVGVLGGGQLGRMMAAAAHRLGIQLIVLDPQGSTSPTGQMGIPAISGSFQDEAAIAELAAQCDVLTIEIEHVNAAFLETLQHQVVVHPSPATIALIQDKYTQKQFFSAIPGVHVAPFALVTSIEDAKRVGTEFGYPYMLKSRRFAYDGKGNAVVQNPNDIPNAFRKLGVGSTNSSTDQLYAEKWVPFTKELAVMVVKGSGGQVRAYPVVETTQEDSICATVLAPAQISADIAQNATKLATTAIAALPGLSYGIYGIELFLTADNAVLLNEIAPRPHNSGHYTIEACETDQFEQHLRAICDLPLGGCNLAVGAALMVNVIGDVSASEEISYRGLRQCLSIPGATPHHYGKTGAVRAGRKLGHYTIVAPSMNELEKRTANLQLSIPIKATPVVGIIMGSDSDLPTMAAAAEILESFNVPYELSIVSAHRTPERMYEYAQTAHSRGLQVIIAGAGGAAHLPGMVAALTPLPVVGVPIKTSTLNGQDSLLSIVQMPRGVPVATVAIGNATNAGLLAVRMLGGAYTQAMSQFLAQQRQQVEEKIDTMEGEGWKKYLKQMKH